MSAKYNAKSLQDIAALFKERAEIELHSHHKAKTIKDREVHWHMAIVWQQAAEIVRNTEIVP